MALRVPSSPSLRGSVAESRSASARPNPPWPRRPAAGIPGPGPFESSRSGRRAPAPSRTVVSWAGLRTSCLMVSIGVSLSIGTSNCWAHCFTARSAWGAKPSPSTGRAGVFRCGAEAHSVEGEPLDHELLLGQRLGVELEPDLIGLEQVLGEIERIGDLERLQIHRGLPGMQVELADVHLGAEQLGARPPRSCPSPSARRRARPAGR